MADSYMDIMKEIGCGDGFHIPIANEENKLIENEIKELLKNKAKLLLLDESLDDDLQEKKIILTNLSTQEAQNHKLVITNRKQYETEQQMLIAAQRENEHLSRENKTATKTLNELIDQQNKLQNELTQNNEHVNKLRDTIEWGEETLLSWNNDLAKQNIDVNILETYHLEDNNMFKSLEIQRQCLQRNVLERESIVEQEISEFHRTERELEHISSLTRQARNERKRLIEQWENAAKFLDSNQKETQHLVQKINKTKQECREMYEKIKENKCKYQDYLDNNEELEIEIDKAQKINNNLKLSNLNQLSEHENLQSQVLTAQLALNVLDNKLANERVKRKHMQNEQDRIKTQIQQKEIDIAKLKDDILKIKDKSMTQEEKTNELFKIQDNQKALAEFLLSEKNKVLNMTFNVKVEITQLQSKIDMLTNLIELNRKEQTEMNKEKLKMKQSIMKRKEELYNLNYKLENVRVKMSETKGTVDVEEMENLQVMLQTLNEELTRATNEQTQLKKHLKSAETESRCITKEIEKSAIELETYQKRVVELNIRNEGGEKQIQSLEEQCHRNRMEEIMMKFKVEQMKKMMDNECEKVYSLAQQREEITADIHRRKAEMADTYERLNAERKLLSEEKSSMKRKLDALVQYIEQRKNRYDIFVASMMGRGNSEAIAAGDNSGVSEDDDDDNDDRTSFSLSEHRIKLAREKLELQDVGDELDGRVQKLESNVKAMANTVLLMNATNSCYKAGLTSSYPASDANKDKVDLEKMYINLKSECLQKKNTIENLEYKIRHLEYQYKTQVEELDDLNNLRDTKTGELEYALSEINEQTIKLDRANSRIQFSLKQIDKSFDLDSRSALDLKKRDIMVRMMKRVNKSVLDLLSELSVRNTGVELTAKQYLSEKNLELPSISSLMMNQIKSNTSSSTTVTSTGSSNASVKSYSDDSRSGSYTVVNLEFPSSVHTRNSSGSSISIVKN